MTSASALVIRPAVVDDLQTILTFIRELAAYENLPHEVEVTGERLRTALFPVGERPAAECLLAWNRPAIDVHERLGARRLAEWTTCRLAGETLARFARPTPATA